MGRILDRLRHRDSGVHLEGAGDFKVKHYNLWQRLTFKPEKDQAEQHLAELKAAYEDYLTSVEADKS